MLAQMQLCIFCGALRARRALFTNEECIGYTRIAFIIDFAYISFFLFAIKCLFNSFPCVDFIKFEVTKHNITPKVKIL